MIPFHFFPLVGFLLHLKHVVVKVLLEFLVCIVDTQLLKAINFEDFKSNDIKYPDDFWLTHFLLVPFHCELLIYS